MCTCTTASTYDINRQNGEKSVEDIDSQLWKSDTCGLDDLICCRS
jgi:hypothetical protein